MIKNCPGKAGDAGFDPWVKKMPGEGMITHSSNSAWRVLDRGAWQATDTTEPLTHTELLYDVVLVSYCAGK